MPHKSEDFKISAVEFYLDSNKTQEEVCNIFKCSVRSLMRWIDKFKKTNSIKRNSRKPESYKINKDQVKYAILKLKENEQITMEELVKIIKKYLSIISYRS